MRHIKHFLAILLVLCSTVASAHDFEVDGIYYNITDATAKTVEVAYSGSYSFSVANEYTGAVIIPSTVTYNGATYSVTSIGNNAFYDCSGLTSIEIPNSVTSIGYNTFSGCTGLTSIVIPNSVTSIGRYAFRDCTGLTSIVIPNSVTSIGDNAFYNCTGLTSVTIPNSVTSIEYQAFYNCTGLTSIEIPNSVTSIGNDAFYDCSGLTSIEIPNSVTSIGGSAFNGCRGLTSVTIGNSVTSIEGWAFSRCTGLTSVVIPNSVTSIGELAFNYCTGLKTVYNCSSLNIVAGSTGNGYVAYYADKVINAPNGFIEGDFVFARTKVTSLQFTTADGLPGTVTGSNHIWESPVINSSTNGVRITVLATNGGSNMYYYNGYPIVALGELEFYDGNGNKINYTASNVTTNSLEGSEGSLAALCDGSYSTFYHSTWSGNGTTPTDYVYLDVKFPQTVDAFKIKMVGRNTKSLVPTEINVASTGGIIINNDSLVYYIGDDTALVLPENCNGNNYTIGADAFRDNTAITSIVIPNSVTSIGNDAFRDCSGLTGVTIGNSVTSIGSSAFRDCTGLTSVTIPNSVTSIGDNAFYGCTGLTSIEIPNSVKSIGNDAFRDCTGLTGVTIGNSVTSIGSSAFRDCTGLTSVTIPNSVKSIGDNAFYGCTGLTGIEIPNSVTSIGNDAFRDCSGLTGVTIGNSVTSIGSSAFRDCTGLTGIEIPNSVTSIGEYAFQGCRSLTSIEIPNSVTSIGDNAFCGCTGLTGIEIPNSVTSIGDYAFYNCTGLTSVTIGNSVTSIGGFAFASCTGLTGIEIPNSVTSIGEYAFAYCRYLTSVTIGNSVTSIGRYAFSDCHGLTAVHINDLAAWCRIDFSSDSSNPLSYAHNLYLNEEKVTDLVIPNSVTSIGELAFYGCSGLTSVTIPNSVTSIGGSAFAYCTGLTNITVNSGNSIYDSREGCNAIIETATNTLIAGCKNTIIPNSVTSIDGFAFNGCSGLTSVTIGDGVTSIGDNAFYGCENLKTVTNNSSLNIVVGSTDNGYVAYYADKVINADGSNNGVIGDYKFTSANGVNTLVEYFGDGGDITLPENYNGENYVIGSSVFQDNTTITGVTIPAGVTAIGESVFYGCTGLTSVTIGDGVTSIGDNAFYGCSGLISVTIPAAVTSIGNNAFYGCNIAKTIWQTNTPPSGYSNAEGSINYVANNQYTSLKIVVVYPYLSSLFEVDGIKYVPVSPAERTCDAIDCTYDTAVRTINIAKTVLYKNLVMNVKEVKPYICYKNKNIETLNISNDGSIGDYAFDYCSGLTSVTIGNSVTGIGNSAFFDCSGLTSVTINDGVTSIGESAFSGCNRLAGITIPNSVTSIGSNAFQSCSELTSVTIGNSVKSIGSNAFQSCSGLTSVTIPNSVTSIGNGAFEGCTSLKKLYIENGDNILTLGYNKYNPNTAGDGLFYDCPLEIIYLGRNLSYGTAKDVGFSPFYNKETLKSLTIGNSVTGIGDNAFYSCDGLTSIEIPNSVTSIGDNAFYGCSAITGVTIGDGVTSIGESAFYGCTGLTSITIPNSVTGIGDNAFYNCTGLTSVTIGNSVTSIGNSAFRGCTGLTGVTIGNSVTSIGESAFQGCTGLTSIEIPNSVTSIGNNAFYDCTGLTGITIGNSVTSIGESVFYGCTGLTAVHINDLASWCRIYFSGSFSNPLSYAHNLYLNGELVTNLVIPSDITEIKNYAFYNCTDLTGVTIGNSVTSIGESAFQGCDSLTGVTIGNNVTDIGDEAFYGCGNLKTVINLSLLTFSKGSTDYGRVAYYANDVINATNGSIEGDIVFGIIDGINTLCRYIGDGGNVTLPADYKGENYVIGARAFSGCSSLYEIIIPQATTKISDYAFTGCSSLADVIIEDRDVALSLGSNGSSPLFADCPLDSVYIGGKIIYDTSSDYGYSPFYRNTSLRSIVITDTEEQIYDNEFYGCTGLKNVQIGDRVKSIGNWAFSGCSSLPEIIIPQATTKISDYAFTGCSSLADVIIEDRDVALFLGSNGSSPLFADCPLDSVYIGGKIIYNTSSDYGYSPFYRNTSLRSIVITDTEEQIYDNEFYGCTGLKNVQIGDRVKSIGNWAFSGCSNLDYLIVGASVGTIGQEAFSDCTNVTTIYAYATMPPVCGAQALEDINKWNCTLMVPNRSIADYQVAEQWKDFFFISEIPTIAGDINGDSEVNVGDFASLVNLIFNSDNIDAATMAVADINGDGEVNVGDFAGLVNLIFNSGSQAAPKRAAALAATVEPSLYIEPFSIAPGEQKQIEVLLDNPGEKFSQLQFDLALPDGVEIVFDEDNFCYTIDRGSRLASVYNIDAQDVNGGVKVLALTTNPKAYIKGESGDVVLITVQAADDIADGVYDLSIDNVVLSHQDGSTVKAASTTAAITVSSTTGLTNIEGAEGSDVYYDLQGRVVKEPSNGIYIYNGKKVFVK